jgi:hypothetical protein
MEKKLKKKEMCLTIANYLNRNKQNFYFVKTDEQLAKFMMSTYSIEKIKEMYSEVINEKHFSKSIIMM